MRSPLLKFLIKIEEAIDNTILNLIEKMKKATPHSVYAAIDWCKKTPALLKTFFVKKVVPKLRIYMLKFVGYSQHYMTLIQGKLIAINLYLKSDEFKKANKAELILAPLKKFKTDPIKAFSVLLFVLFLGAAGVGIFKNAEKIAVGVKALRAPAAADLEDPILVFNKLKFDIIETEVFLDVTIVASSIEERDKLIQIEKDIEHLILGLKFHVMSLPLTHDDTKAIEKEILSKISGAKIKNVEVKQVLEGRPKYFMQTEKLLAFKDLNLQLFLEDTRRNRQIWVDFTCLTSNRNIILFLKDHMVETRDYLNMNVEPVIPQLPIEEEGRQIIKEKIKLELNEFLKANKIEGKILEIYVDYLIVT